MAALKSAFARDLPTYPLKLSHLAVRFVFRPSCFRGFDRRCPALFGCHGDQTALPPDGSAFAPHSGHYAGDVGFRYSWRTWLPIFGAGRATHHLEGGLIYVGGAVGVA